MGYGSRGYGSGGYGVFTSIKRIITTSGKAATVLRTILTYIGLNGVSNQNIIQTRSSIQSLSSSPKLASLKSMADKTALLNTSRATRLGSTSDRSQLQNQNNQNVSLTVGSKSPMKTNENAIRLKTKSNKTPL